MLKQVQHDEEKKKDEILKQLRNDKEKTKEKIPKQDLT